MTSPCFGLDEMETAAASMQLLEEGHLDWASRFVDCRCTMNRCSRYKRLACCTIGKLRDFVCRGCFEAGISMLKVLEVVFGSKVRLDLGI